MRRKFFSLSSFSTFLERFIIAGWLCVTVFIFSEPRLLWLRKYFRYSSENNYKNGHVSQTLRSEIRKQDKKDDDNF